jgi:hypothetical protein
MCRQAWLFLLDGPVPGHTYFQTSECNVVKRRVGDRHGVSP